MWRKIRQSHPKRNRRNRRRNDRAPANPHPRMKFRPLEGLPGHRIAAVVEHESPSFVVTITNRFRLDQVFPVLGELRVFCNDFLNQS
mmetsp:Transcript_26330/g.55243  ORF Transcript_26330/g.55243 Transcript_26330/m.55243 type:complete len:87 (+) Transcript_26330:2766-3026(+)